MSACLRQFLTPAAWRQAQKDLRKPRKDARWGFHHLTLVLLAMTWCLGDSAPERFEMARGIVALCRPKRRRAGQTFPGFRKALVRLPVRPLVALSAAVRARLLVTFGTALRDGGFIPIGCDGSRQEAPRTDELLRRCHGFRLRNLCDRRPRHGLKTARGNRQRGRTACPDTAVRKGRLL
jgi:hypothetical protein